MSWKPFSVGIGYPPPPNIGNSSPFLIITYSDVSKHQAMQCNIQITFRNYNTLTLSLE